VQQIPQDYKNVSRVLQLSQKDYFLQIVFPATVPYIFTGLRIGIGLSWLAIVAAEMRIGGGELVFSSGMLGIAPTSVKLLWPLYM
jgi:nitrate/nitrite transport system permease protein